MNKGEHNHLHGYQDQKDGADRALDERSSQITEELWNSGSSIANAITESLAESAEYIMLIKYCQNNDSAQVLGAITLDLIDAYLFNLAEELAEEELT